MTGHRRRSARLVIALTAGLVVAGGVAVVANRTPEADPVQEATEALELHGPPADDLLRSSERLARPTPEKVPDVTTGTRPGEPVAEGEGPSGAPTGGPTAPTAPMRRRSDARIGAADDAPTGGGVGSPGPGPQGAIAPPPNPATPLPPPFYLPGPGLAPVVGPIGAPADDDQEPPVDLHEPLPDDQDPPAPTPYEAELPDPDEEGCPNLNLYPIGGYSQDAPSTFAALSPSFRALAPAEWSSPTLVCAHALEPWRDLVVQRLVSAGHSDGALVTAADGSSIVMRLTEIEWTAYRFRYGGGPIGPNLLGYPVERTTSGTVTLLRTTAGALVFGNASSMGVPVLGGAWDRWMQEGGPDGPMGLPSGIPEAATGPIGAHLWSAGLPATGARQEFSTGWLFLPGVLSDLEAVAQPAERYEWHDVSELDAADPVDYRGHIMQLSGISYYVDREGIRHWIRSTSDWSCAHWDLQATEYSVRGHELAAYPLGDEFVCTDFKD